jgi:hypothetical protein
VYLLYLDESGAPENPEDQYFVMGGIAVFERQTHWLSEAVEQVQANHLPNVGPVEFHAQAIGAHKVAPWNAMSSAARYKLLDDLYDVIANTHKSAALFAVALHKASFPGDDPVAKCFEDLCSRFDLLLKRLHAQGDTQRGLMILDESKYESRLQTLLGEYRKGGTRYRPVVNFADIPLFADSKATRLLQIADFVAHAVYRRYERGDTKYFDRIVNRFDAEGGRMHGLVHLGRDLRSCMCPACLTRRMQE